ncbi:Uncharacterised protein [uncultured archaeon]|nr:Uncharacterised protein [uncultured archaeon]
MEDKETHKQNILNCIKKNEETNKETNLAELKKLNKQHQPILYNIRRLLSDGTIKPYIKIDSKVVKSIGITDNEIFFTIVNNYEYPQDVLKLIDVMCGDEKSRVPQAYEHFISLCMEKGSKDELEKMKKDLEKRDIKPTVQNFGVEPAKIESVRRLATQLMSNMVPGLKEDIAFALTSDHIQYRLQRLNSFY